MTEYFTIEEVEEMVREEAPEDYDGAFCWRAFKDGPRLSRHREEGTVIGSLQATREHPSPPVFWRWHPENSVLSIYDETGKRIKFEEQAILTDEGGDLLTDWGNVKRKMELTRNSD